MLGIAGTQKNPLRGKFCLSGEGNQGKVPRERSGYEEWGEVKVGGLGRRMGLGRT